MTETADRLQTHALAARLSAVSETLQSLDAELREQADAVEPTGTLTRAHRVAEYGQASLAIADPDLITVSMLDNAATAAGQLGNQLVAFRDSQNAEQQIPAIADAAEALAHAFASFPVVWAGQEQESRAAAAAVERHITDREGRLREELSSIEARLDELRGRLDTGQEELNTQLQTQAEELNSRLQELAASIGTQQTANDTLVEGLRTEFDQAEEARKTQFAADLEQAKSDATEVVRAVKATSELELKALRDEAEQVAVQVADSAKTITDNLSTQATEVLDELKVSRDEAAELVDLVATSSTAGAYGKEADAQKKEADDWRDTAVKFGIAAGAVALVAVIVGLVWKESIGLGIGKGLLVVALAGVAGYAAAQSTRHRRREEQSRRIQLELAAFDPFIRRLTEENQEKVREAFVERAFVGHDRDTESASGLPAITQNEITLIGQLMKVITGK